MNATSPHIGSQLYLKTQRIFYKLFFRFLILSYISFFLFHATLLLEFNVCLCFEANPFPHENESNKFVPVFGKIGKNRIF